MGDFSARLTQYLEGRISFEEFESLHGDALTRHLHTRPRQGLVGGEDDEQRPGCSSQARPQEVVASRKPSDSDGSSDETADGVSKKVQRAFDLMMENRVTGSEEEVADNEDLETGDVFALEMELQREHKRLQKERLPRSKLPKALRGLMGEANIRFARGEHEETIKMCMEIIRQAPLAHEPFSTLAMLYEDCGDMEKSLQFGLIAAYLNPSDPEEWVKLAELSLEQDNIKQAIFCYTKAIKYSPSNTQYLWERSNLYEQLGEHKQAMDGYRRILALLPESEGDHFMQITRDMANIHPLTSFSSRNCPSTAIHWLSYLLPLLVAVVRFALQNSPCSSLKFTPGQVNSDSLLMCFSWCSYQCMCYTSFPSTTSFHQCQNRRRCLAPSHRSVTPIHDFHRQFHHCQLVSPVPDSPLLSVIVEQFNTRDTTKGYFFYIGIHLTLREWPNNIIRALLFHTISTAFRSILPRATCAECLNALGLTQRAAESYNQVVALAPMHLGARMSLSALQQQLGQPEKALEALNAPHTDELSDCEDTAKQEIQLLLHRSILLFSQRKMADCVDTHLMLLSMLLKGAMVRSQVSVVSSTKDGARHLYLLKRSDETPKKGTSSVLDNMQGKASLLGREIWWDLLQRAVCELANLGRHDEAELLCNTGLEFYYFYEDRPKRKELESLGLSAAFLSKNFRKAYNYIRIILMENLNKPQLWNIFNQITANSQDIRHHRFCLRLLLKNPDNLPLCILNGHNAFVAGSFKHALGQYVQAYRTNTKEPMFCLCIGLTFVHMASQKFANKRHPLIIQGFSFLMQYLELRGHGQESYYNVGRALHQLGLTHLAIHYYQQTLACPPPQCQGMDPQQLDLRREAAYNLSLIYQSSGNPDMARATIHKYIVI
uniref:General transcription factor IIIC, polypeptide 3 n=1 Tax=Petromyzon marinus TaxID=7757 RepID=S4R4R8_PETMA